MSAPKPEELRQEKDRLETAARLLDHAAQYSLFHSDEPLLFAAQEIIRSTATKLGTIADRTWKENTNGASSEPIAKRAVAPS